MVRPAREGCSPSSRAHACTLGAGVTPNPAPLLAQRPGPVDCEVFGHILRIFGTHSSLLQQPALPDVLRCT